MTTIIFAVVLPWLLLACGVWLGYQLVRQNGRILLRLEAMEKQLGPRAPAQRREAGGQSVALSVGLAVGTVAPDFALPDLAGVPHKLSEFRGQDVLLIFFNPKCGFCTRMAADLATLPGEAGEGRAVPVVVTTGDADENRKLALKYGIRCVILLQEQMEVAAQFRAQGTPIGYRIDAAGRIASELAVGAEPLLQLAASAPAVGRGSPDPAHTIAVGRGSPDPARMIDRRSPGHAHVGDLRSGVSARSETFAEHGAHKGLQPDPSLARSRLNRSGLAAGALAPEFQLPRVGGGELSLADLRGRRVLLVFSDPNCGPCDELAPQLEVLHRQRTDLQVVMISRRDAEATAAKAAAMGLRLPIAMQKQWELSLKYGMFATPIGYLIDEQGIIVRDVAVGVEPILALADEPVPAAADVEPSPCGKEAALTT